MLFAVAGNVVPLMANSPYAYAIIIDCWHIFLNAGVVYASRMVDGTSEYILMAIYYHFYYFFIKWQCIYSSMFIFGIGIIVVVFHSSGKKPVNSDSFMMFANK